MSASATSFGFTVAPTVLRTVAAASQKGVSARGIQTTRRRDTWRLYAVAQAYAAESRMPTPPGSRLNEYFLLGCLSIAFLDPPAYWVVGIGSRIGDDDRMPLLKLARVSADYALLLAKRRADRQVPFSPAWDAAMAAVDECEREAYRVDQIELARIVTTTRAAPSL